MTESETLPFTAWEISVLEEAVKTWAELPSNPQIAKIHAEQLATRLSYAKPSR